MAKRRTKAQETAQHERARAVSTAGVVESTIEELAEDLGKFLGTAQAKAENWLAQRKAIADRLSQIRDTAQNLLSELAGSAAKMAVAVRRRGRRGRHAGAKKKAKLATVAHGKRQRRQVSAKARAAMSAAQKARWARQRDEKNS